jgi:hypothetical protein
MLGWFGKRAQTALVVSIFVLLVSPAVGAVWAGGVATQARQYLATASTTASAFYHSQILRQFGESVTLLVLGAGFLMLARRVQRPGAPKGA